MNHRLAANISLTLSLSTAAYFTYLANGLLIENTIVKIICGLSLVIVPTLIVDYITKKYLPAKCPNCSNRLKHVRYVQMEKEEDLQSASNSESKEIGWFTGYICENCKFNKLYEITDS